MGRRRCCCAGCWEFEDLFARSDGNDPGSDWNVVTGDWGIESEQLTEIYSDTAGTSGAKIICEQTVPARSPGEMYIEIEVPISTVEDGDNYYVYPCCPSNSTLGDLTVEYSYVSATSEWTVTISEGATTHATYTTTLTGSPTNVTLICCADHGNTAVKARVSPTVNEYTAWASVDPGDGRFAGFGHDNTGHQNVFDNFYLAELRANAELCVECFCQCGDLVVPDTLTATIVNTTNRLTCLEGESWTLNARSDGAQVFEWQGEYSNSGDTFDAVLTCGTGSATSFTLKWQTPCDCGTSSGSDCGIENADASSVCDPLYLLFGPYTVTFASNCDWCYSYLQPPGCVGPPPIPDDCSGEFWIAITEA